jgi:LysM repeat protein
MKKKFNFRGFVSLFVSLLFIITAVSGIVLYISPAARFASDSSWSVFALNKYQWRSVHTIFTFLFIITVTFHLFFNWRPLLAYLRRKMESHIRLRKEFICASMLTVFLFFLLVKDMPPFSNIMELRDDFKYSVTSSNSVNTNDLDDAAVDTAKICIAQSSGGEKSCRDCTLESCIKTGHETAVKKSIPASKSVLKNTSHNTEEKKGIGKKTIGQLSADHNLSGKEGISMLSAKGIKAGTGDKVKEIAEKYNMRPSDINSILSSKQ